MKVPDDSAEVTMFRLEGPCGMGLLSSGMLSLTQLRIVSPSWQKVQ